MGYGFHLGQENFANKLAVLIGTIIFIIPLVIYLCNHCIIEIYFCQFVRDNKVRFWQD